MNYMTKWIKSNTAMSSWVSICPHLEGNLLNIETIENVIFDKENVIFDIKIEG